MLFEIIHTHTSENCPARSPEHIRAFSDWWTGFKNKSGIKVLAGYVSPLDHAYYITVEADNYAALVKELGQLMTQGTGRVIPILTLDQTIPMAQAGELAEAGSFSASR